MTEGRLSLIREFFQDQTLYGGRLQPDYSQSFKATQYIKEMIADLEYTVTGCNCQKLGLDCKSKKVGLVRLRVVSPSADITTSRFTGPTHPPYS